MRHVTVTGLDKAFGAEPILAGLDLEVPAGSLTAILGPSGSGKTTLLRLLAGFERADAGTISIGGVLADGPGVYLPPERRRIGYVPQEGSLFPHLTVAGNVGFGLPARRPGARQRRGGTVEALLETVGLAGFGRRYPHQLSGGQQQRVGVARALAAEPAVLLMDEPFGALDPIIRTKAQDDLLDIQRRFGTTIVLVTHDMDEAFRLGARVAVMSGGKLLQYDRPATLLKQPADPLVTRMTGQADRAIKLLSLTTAGEVALPGESDGPPVAAAASLREVLSQLLWCGANSVRVVGEDGTTRGHLTVAAILAHGRP